VVEREVDGLVGPGRCLTQPLEVVEITPEAPRAERRDGGDRAVRPCETEYLMPARDQLRNYCRGDLPGDADYEDSHLLIISSDGCRVDHEAVVDIGVDDAVPGLIDLLGGDQLDLCADVVRGAEVEHLLGFADPADW